MNLQPHHIEWLRAVCARGSIPTDEIDGRGLRPLLRLELVEAVNGSIRATREGRAVAQRDHSQLAPRSPRQLPAAAGGLSEAQEEVLRYLLRQTGPVPTDHVDGRVSRALQSRGLIQENRGWVSPTEAAEPYLRSHTRKDRERSVRRAGNSARGARGEAILRAVEALEEALPRGAELMIGELPAYGDDVVSALRRLAREME
jgi:hypothetical protein